MVMKQNAMQKNLYQSIKNSVGRYIALALIICLGASLFMGLVITRQNMVHTGQHFMDQQNMFDLRMISNYGWDEKYVEEFAALPGVKDAEGVVYLDLIARTEDMTEDSVYRFYAIPQRMNQISLRSGRMPQTNQECLVEGFLTDDSILGKTITISKLNEKDSLDALHSKTFTVVGRIASPLYLDMNRGTTAVGSGSLEHFYYLPAEAFDVDYCTEINLTLEEHYPIYSEEYHNYLEDSLDTLEDDAEKLSLQRFLDVKTEAEEEYDEGYQEYQDGLKEFEEEKAKAEQELADAYQELKDAEEELEDGRKQLINAGNQIEEGKKQIQAAEAKLAAGEAEAEAQLATVQASLLQAQSGIAAIEGQAGMSGSQIQSAYAAASQGMSSAAGAVSTVKQALAEAEAAEQPDAALIASLQQQLQGAESAHANASAQLEALTPLYNNYNTAVGALSQLQSAEASLKGALKQISSAKVTLQEEAENLHHAENKLWISWGEWGEARDEIEEGWVEYEEAQVEFHKEIVDAEAVLKDAEAELKEAREKIDDMEKPDLIMLSRTSNVGYNNLDSSSNIVAGVARVLPVFFLLVAALVCITTMTRMIDEERTQIGTLKALGYTNNEIMRKYLIYSGSSAIIGCCLGLLLGCTIIPMIIWEAYKIMLYVQPNLLLTVNWPLCFAIVVVYTALMLFVTWYSCRKTLEEEPAQLIRPKAPDPGKKILLEYLKIWQKLSFLNKVTLRNIFRYRQRLAMMLIGISGCTALLLTGFGLRDSIVNIVPKQYAEITHYDMTVYFRDTPTQRERLEFSRVVADADDSMFYHQSSVDLGFRGRTKELYMISGSDQLTGFIDLHRGDTPVSLPGMDEVVLSVGVCENLGIQAGDTLTLRNADLQSMELTVSAIYDNYVDNFALVHPDTIEKHWGSPPEEQMAFVRVRPEQDVYAVGAAITDLKTVLNVSISKDLADMIGGMMDALDLVIILIVVSAGLLAVTVLYNLTNINIKERIREIATIKVLGFRASETGTYVFKENLLLTVAGSVIGLGLGWLLLVFVISQIKIDMVWFKVVIEPISCFLAIALTLVSALVVDFVFYFKLDKINMAEALKSVE